MKVFDSRRIGNFFNFESKATWTLFSLFAILFFGFFYKILNTKVETKAIKKFEGRIVKTTFYGKKDKSVGILMEEFPDYVFNTYSRSFGYDFNKKDWIDHQKISIYNGKKAIIYISASDYDWKTQNKLIRALHFDNDFNFSIEDLKIEM